jgi:hypothetical protein
MLESRASIRNPPAGARLRSGLIAALAVATGGAAVVGSMTTGAGFARAASEPVVHVPCSAPDLYKAVANPEPGEVLVLASFCDYVLSAQPLVLSGQIRLTGGPSTHLRTTSADRHRVVEVAKDASVGIHGVFIEGGRAPGDDSRGGGIDNSGSLFLDHDTIKGNSALLGAGIFNRGRVVLTSTLVQGNDSSSPGRARAGHRVTAADVQFAGAGVYSTGDLQAANSIVDGNHAGNSGGQAAGGGIYSAGRLVLTQTTISANVARGDGGQAAGGGVYIAAGSALLSRTLIDRNAAGSGGGIFSVGGGGVTLQNSLVRNNTPNNCAPAGSVAGCVGVRFRRDAPRFGAPRSGVGAARGGRRAPSSGRGAPDAG